MPHFIDVATMESLQAEFPDQWAATSTHRFRSSEDMQYGFAYFYWIMNRDSLKDLDWAALWSKELDVDGSGLLEENELTTLVAMSVGKEPTMTQVHEIRDCLGRAGEERRVDPMTLTALVHCDVAVDGLRKHARQPAGYHKMPNLNEVAFEMIGDDFNKVGESGWWRAEGVKRGRRGGGAKESEDHAPTLTHSSQHTPATPRRGIN